MHTNPNTNFCFFEIQCLLHLGLRPDAIVCHAPPVMRLVDQCHPFVIAQVMVFISCVVRCCLWCMVLFMVHVRSRVFVWRVRFCFIFPRAIGQVFWCGMICWMVQFVRKCLCACLCLCVHEFVLCICMFLVICLFC